MAFFWHDDPLAGLPEIAPHPGRSESPSSAAVSSPPTSPIIRQNFTDIVNNILSEYQPIHASDDTVKVLRAFVDNLSGQGLSRLQSEIYEFAKNPHQLRQLRNSLTDGILKPMAAAGGKQPPVTPSPNQSAAFEIELAMTQIEGSSRTGHHDGHARARSGTQPPRLHTPRSPPAPAAPCANLALHRTRRRPRPWPLPWIHPADHTMHRAPVRPHPIPRPHPDPGAPPQVRLHLRRLRRRLPEPQDAGRAQAPRQIFFDLRGPRVDGGLLRQQRRAHRPSDVAPCRRRPIHMPRGRREDPRHGYCAGRVGKRRGRPLRGHREAHSARCG